MVPLSYLSPRTTVKPSPIQGRGLFATEPIHKGEIVCVKGGYIFNRQKLQEVSQSLGPSEIQIAEDMFIGPLNEEEREASMIFSNHSCDPNIGVQGQIVFVAMRDIDAGVSVQWSTPELQGAIGGGAFTSQFNGAFAGEHELTQYFPDGTPHGSWTVKIEKTASIFEIFWRKGENIHFSGLGLEMSNGLAVSWYPDIRQLALLDYIIDPEDRECLIGTWALGGFTSLGTEILKRK